MTTAPLTTRRPFYAFLGFTLLFALSFAGWSFIVLTGTTVADFDLRLAEDFARRASDAPLTRWAMVVATSCGGIRANVVLALGGAFVMWRFHQRHFAIAWLVISLVGGLIILELKDLIDRGRPPVTLRDIMVHQENASYPSGHAMGSVVGYGMVGFVLLKRVKNVPLRWLIGGLLTAWVIVIGFSRVYLRAHWASDIVGGWLLGLAYMNACLAIYFWRPRKITSPGMRYSESQGSSGTVR